MSSKLKYYQNGCHAQCEYRIGKIDSKTVLIFVQTQESSPSITNSIEALFPLVLESDLKGVPPSDVRVFEYYPKPDALTKLQEVTFSVRPIHGFGGKLFNKEPEKWSIVNPVWHSVDSETSGKLMSILV